MYRQGGHQLGPPRSARRNPRGAGAGPGARIGARGEGVGEESVEEGPLSRPVGPEASPRSGRAAHGREGLRCLRRASERSHRTGRGGEIVPDVLRRMGRRWGGMAAAVRAAIDITREICFTPSLLTYTLSTRTTQRHWLGIIRPFL